MASKYGPGYAKWAEGVLGQALPARTWADNPIVGAVAGGSGQFTFFVDRFAERLVRLWKALPKDRTTLLEKVANVGTDGWKGYWAELAAWDFFAESVAESPGARSVEYLDTPSVVAHRRPLRARRRRRSRDRAPRAKWGQLGQPRAHSLHARDVLLS